MAQGTAIPLGGEQVHFEANQRKLAAAVFRIVLEDLKASHPSNRRAAPPALHDPLAGAPDPQAFIVCFFV